jgi:predicted signal transduction protein with EAL and GGDEF domain
LAFGDQVLRAIDSRLNPGLRDFYAVGRTGGDGFGIVVRGVDAATAAALAAKLVRCLASELLQLHANAFVSVSIGTAVTGEHAVSATNLVAQAEHAQGMAKSNGRNQAVLYTQPPDGSTAEPPSSSLARTLHNAITDGRLVLAYQPVMRAETVETAFYECLLRLRNADGTITAAGALVPVAEDVGLIRAIDRWVLEQVIEDLVTYPLIHLSMNVSGYTTNNPT